MNAMLHQADMTAPVLTRLLLVALFPLSAFDTVVHWRAAVQLAQARLGRPGRLLVAAGVVVEVSGFVCVLLNWHQREAAVILALFCFTTAFGYHRFWIQAGYWTADGGPARHEFWEFSKDISVAGGLLLYASMVGTIPVSAMLGMAPH